MADTAGKLFIEIVSSGFAKVQKDVDALKRNLQSVDPAVKAVSDRMKALSNSQGIKNNFTLGGAFTEGLAKASAGLQMLSERMKGIGQMAGSIFTKATAGITAGFAIADPKGFDNLQVALFKVGLQLGRFVIPLVREVTARFEQLTAWLKSLSDDTRENVLHWVKIGLAVSGVLMVLPKLISIASSVVSVFTMLKTAFAALWAASPLGLFTLLVAGLSAFGEADTFLGGLVNAFNMIKSVLQPIIDIVVAIGGIFADVFGGIVSVLQGMLPTLQAVVTFILIFKGALLAMGLASGLAVGGMGALAGATRMLSGAFSALLAHPVVAVIAGITTAVMALTGAFGNSTIALANLLNKIMRLEELEARLAAGGKLSKKEAEEFLPKDLRDKLRGTKDEKEKDKILSEAEDTAKKKVSDKSISDEQKSQIEDILRKERGHSIFSDRTNQRQREIEGVLRRKFTDEEQAGFRGIDQGKGIIMKDAKRSFDSEDIQKTFGVLGKGSQEGKTELEAIKAVREGRVQGGKDGKGDEKFRGEMRPMKADLTSIQDYWSKLVTAQQDDPKAKMMEEQLEETKKQGKKLDRIGDNTDPDGKKSRDGIVIE